MRKKKNLALIKQKVKSEKGFTMQDLVAGCIILTIFAATITALMISVYKTNIKTKLTSQMAVYSIKILEDIDKISYEEVENKTGEYYTSKFQIPAGFNVNLDIADYGENLQDVIKIVNLKISYTFRGETTEYTVQKLKMKEV